MSIHQLDATVNHRTSRTYETAAVTINGQVINLTRHDVLQLAEYLTELNSFMTTPMVLRKPNPHHYITHRPCDFRP